jgi:hypothetical protein
MKYVVDESGEVLDSIDSTETYVKLNSGDRVLRKDYIEKIDKHKSINMRFAKINFLVNGDISRKYSIFPYLIQYVGYMNGVLRHRNGRLLTNDTIGELCHVSKITAIRQLRGMIKDDIIRKIKTDDGFAYVMNPFIVHLGKEINDSLYDMFKNSKYSVNYEKTLGDYNDFK